MLHTKLNDGLVLWTYTITPISFKKLFEMPPQGGRGGEARFIQFSSYLGSVSSWNSHALRTNQNSEYCIGI